MFSSEKLALALNRITQPRKEVIASVSLAALIVMSVVMAADFGSASATFPGANGRIVFASDRDGNDEIYVMNDDGSAQTRLTNYSGTDTQPRWSPDGTKIAFNRDGQIYVMNADGSGQTNISNASPANDANPSWSPDGTKIVFDSAAGEDRGIFVMNADGSGRTKLIDHGENPAWTPDGSKIAFSIIPAGVNSRIVIMDADGTDPVQISVEDTPEIAPGFELWVNWSPDGTRLAFAGSFAGPNIYTANADGSDLRRVSGQWDLHPSWAPDGTKIVFTKGNGPFDHSFYEIFAINPDGTGLTRLTINDARDEYPDWGVSPNVVPPQESQLTVKTMDLNGGPLSGIWTTVRTMDGTLVKSGFTPLLFTGSTGTQYRITVADYDGKIFDMWWNWFWQGGGTSRSMVITLASDTTLKAIYDTGDSLRGFTSLTYTGTEEQPDLTVNAVSLDGSKALHMWTVIDPQSTDASGTMYKVYATNGYQDLTFDHWDDGSTDRVRTLTVGEATTITAYYQAG